MNAQEMKAEKRITPVADSLELDGFGCPMAHCNRNDDSLQDLPPFRCVETAKKITDPRVSSRAFVHLGAFTGETMAVCAYDSPAHPALVAYDYQDGSIRWTSPLQDLPGLFHRWPSGILMAQMGMNRKRPETYIFAANPVEFVAYKADGTRLWKRLTTEITDSAPDGVGLPTSLSFTDAHELVCATTKGWIIKLDPACGIPIDAYKMDTRVFVQDLEYQGTFVTTKSPAVVGNIMYLLVDFRPNVSIPPLDPLSSPVHLVRIVLSQPGVPGAETRIKPLANPTNPQDAPPDRCCVGIFRGTGSPPALVGPNGKVLLFAHAHAMTNRGLQPTITAVKDEGGVLTSRWQSVLDVAMGDDVYAAPALHADSGTLLVTSLNNIYVFRNVGGLSGHIPAPIAIPPQQLIANGRELRVESVQVGSPFALTFDPDADEIVAYTNFRLIPRHGLAHYGFLGAFALPAHAGGAARPLWHRPLAIARNGGLAPGLGTFGQPALFRYRRGGEEATGLIVNTVATGTFIFK